MTGKTEVTEDELGPDILFQSLREVAAFFNVAKPTTAGWRREGMPGETQRSTGHGGRYSLRDIARWLAAKRGNQPADDSDRKVAEHVTGIKREVRKAIAKEMRSVKQQTIKDAATINRLAIETAARNVFNEFLRVFKKGGQHEAVACWDSLWKSSMPVGARGLFVELQARLFEVQRQNRQFRRAYAMLTKIDRNGGPVELNEIFPRIVKALARFDRAYIKTWPKPFSVRKTGNACQYSLRWEDADGVGETVNLGTRNRFVAHAAACRIMGLPTDYKMDRSTEQGDRVQAEHARDVLQIGAKARKVLGELENGKRTEESPERSQPDHGDG